MSCAASRDGKELLRSPNLIRCLMMYSEMLRVIALDQLRD